MRQSRFTEARIIGMIKEQEAGMPTAEVCRRHGLSRNAASMRGDHQPLKCSAFDHQCGEYPVEYTQPRSACEPVIQGLCGP